MGSPTRTTNRLHFSDLDPLRFEDLCLNLVLRLENWKEINHFGRKGSDGGIDILAINREKDIEQVWFIQCKRYSTLRKVDIKEIIDKVLSNPSVPDKLLLIVSCDVSMVLIQYFKKYSNENGILDAVLWTSSVLEAKLYKDHKDLLFVYFGIRLENRTKDNVARIKHSIRMEKRIKKELIDHEYIKKTSNFKIFLFNPAARFISQSVYIRSIDDRTYPNIDESKTGQISPWFRAFFYDTYHDGIELWLNAGLGTTVIIDNDGYWEPMFDYYDKRKESPNYTVIKAKMIGRIPYYNIVDFKTKGDEYTSEPHLFCKFEKDGMPYEEIYYKSEGDPENEIADRELDKDKQTVFLKK